MDKRSPSIDARWAVLLVVLALSTAAIDCSGGDDSDTEASDGDSSPTDTVADSDTKPQPDSAGDSGSDTAPVDGSSDVSDASDTADGRGLDAPLDAGDVQEGCDALMVGYVVKSMVKTRQVDGKERAVTTADADYVANQAQRCTAYPSDFVALPKKASTSDGGFGQPTTGDVTLEITVFATSNVDSKSKVEPISAELEATNNRANGSIQGDSTITLDGVGTKTDTIRATIQQNTGCAFAGGTLDRFGTLDLKLKGTNGTMWENEDKPSSVEQAWAVPLSSLLHSLADTISTSSTILSQGISLALGITSAIASRSFVLFRIANNTIQQAMKFAISKLTGVSFPPDSPTSALMYGIGKGIQVFHDVAKELPSKLRDDANWDGKAGVGGLFLMRTANCPAAQAE